MECQPQLASGDGVVEANFVVQSDGSVPKIRILRSEPSGKFGELSRGRLARATYPPSSNAREQQTTERFRNVHVGDWIFVGRAATIDEREYTEQEFSEAADRGTLLWSCGVFSARFHDTRTLCGATAAATPVVNGGLAHATCRSGLVIDESYLVWARRYQESWSAIGVFPIYEPRAVEPAITSWAAWDLLLDRVQVPIPGLDSVADPVFAESTLRPEVLSQYVKNALYTVRDGAVYHATGVYISDAELALTSPAGE